jgi:hypothetical protein
MPIAMVSAVKKLILKKLRPVHKKYSNLVLPPVDAFGPDAGEHNFDRDASVLGKMITFNGNQNDIAKAIEVGDHDTPPRRCPGYGYTLDIIEFLVHRYKPADMSFTVSDYISEERYSQIRRQESPFMKIALAVGSKVYVASNKYFPHASEVKHPLDTKGEPLDFFEFSACGRSRQMPNNGKFWENTKTSIEVRIG